mmetsp:Transcript_2035/g.6011  ORF Transcript_2035/g.6011 Transcript_2035/m.6011 type:complete len:951 (+) Transcript_2035:491-3343(+)|eukprot:CAMPEP_0117669060 /NCGR_PEP_ID=MMETSP0804-20121206/11907_1 /TAXON_ID=1074897 /ORGANISM="Tetraselmis astigmatica, Strain CCMP880" /LENGTH=950 /DNA_ID=CAMNT_0005477045 /DNA_START=424 /DNA_END=3276 /DNA_ORIENTATION=-
MAAATLVNDIPDGPAMNHFEVESVQYVCLHFRVAYMTVWGQRLVVCGDGKVLGNWDPFQGLRMSCHHQGDELVWEAQVSVPYVDSFSYRYVVVDEAPGVVKSELRLRKVELHPELFHSAIVGLWDEWQPGGDMEQMFSTSAFTDAIFQNREMCQQPIQPSAPQIAPEPGMVVIQFTVSCHRVFKEEVVVVTGSSHLGNWRQREALELTRTDKTTWQGEVKVPQGDLPIPYKYAILSKNRNQFLLEPGESRMAAICTGESHHLEGPTPVVLSRHDGFLRRADAWKGSGLAVPVFSLRTKRSVGVGEFRDIKALVDVCVKAGMRLAQLLPVNDTSVYMTQWDSYPYCSLSVHALHPQYLCLEELSDNIPEGIVKQINMARVELDHKDIDYPAVMEAKRKTTQQIFDLEGEAVLKSEAFQAFWSLHKEWLKPYAVFCLLRDLFGTSEHWQWGKLAHPSQEDIDRLAAPGTVHYPSIQMSYYVQFHLHQQLLSASGYAAQHRVALKGDLPIGVDKRSVDTWLHPRLFRMNKSTGAPPDFFDPNGQNWGFPTYVWEEMAKDDYAWWRSRLSHMAQYFHAYRIDHILGFFRIWENPGSAVTAALGTFRPAVALSADELRGVGVWDFQRLVQPYVRLDLLRDIFGSSAEEVACKYFRDAGKGVLVFQERYGSEKDIDTIQPPAGSPPSVVEGVFALKKGLMELWKNVVLLQDEEDKGKFYPRFGYSSTRSWAELDQFTRDALSGLCEDFFHGRQDALWERHALRTLPVIMGATRMLVFGEDLGFVPACVPPVLADLGLFGLRIQRMETPAEGQKFVDMTKYPYMTVASPSCHDTTTIRGWWEEDSDQRATFFVEALEGRGPVPARCTPAIVRTIVRKHMESSSCWAVFPIQDILAMSPRYMTRPALEETINDPTNPKHYWRYRMHVNLEDVAADSSLMADLQAMLTATSRASAADFE